ncbi:glycosyltransferase family 2 protein [bacterium]|nr:MAG: glycosyltransferase family 2 protein [bacterium]
MTASAWIRTASDEEPARLPLVSLVVPAYNEGATLAANLTTIAECLEPHRARYDFELIVVDDGSTDGTYLAASRFADGRSDTLLLRHESNRGLGAALRTAFSRARGTYIVTLDSDLSYRPACAISMLEALVEQEADLVLASAYMPGGSVANVPWQRRVLSREANRFLSLATNARVHTLTCMVRAYRASIIEALDMSADGMEVNPEMIFAALRMGAKIIEIPAHLAWSPERTRGTARLTIRRACAHTLGVLRTGFAYRPALWLGVPGLIPGLLPLTVLVLLLLRVSPAAFAAVTLVVLVVQYASIAILAGQTTVFLGKASIARRRLSASRTRESEGASR